MPLSEPIAWLLIVPTLLYTGGILAIAMWRRRQRSLPPEGLAQVDLPRAAVLVAARNEEEHIGRCLEALIGQNYPQDRLAIYVANDHSTDRTGAILERYQATTPNLHIVEVPEAKGRLRGKALAIHAAIEKSEDELLLMTDADCAPPRDWARTMVEYFEDREVGVITAATTVETDTADRRLLARVQALDWRYLLTASAFLVEIGRPVTAMGNNMAFRRTAYNAVGGYPALPFSVTEDYLLFRKIVEQTAYRARSPVDPRLKNLTHPLPRLREVISQRRRWARGGLRAPAEVYGIYTLTHLAHLLPVILLVLAPIPAAVGLVAKIGGDWALLRTSTDPSSRPELRAFPAWEFYFTVYMCLLPAAVILFPRIAWKGRKL